MTQEEIERLLGGLNGRQPFINYLLRKRTELARCGLRKPQIMKIIARDQRFWATLMKEELARQERRRTGSSGQQHDDAFLHYDFDDLFRYCPDPVKAFHIDLTLPLDDRRMQNLTTRFKQFIESHRRPLPKTTYPLSLGRFYAQAYLSIARMLVNLPLLVSRHRPLIKDFWATAFTATRGEKKRAAQRFWFATLSAGLLFNVAGLLAMAIAYTSGSRSFYLTLTTLLFCLMELFLVPISLRSFIQLGRVTVAFREGRKSGVATIRTWREVRKNFDRVWRDLDGQQRRGYFRMVDEIYANHLVDRQEYEQLIARNSDAAAPGNGQAQDRIKRWMNLCYMNNNRPASTAGCTIPALSSWAEVASVTILVFSLNEKFSYSWDELTTSELGGKPLVEPLLNTLRRAYADEWENMIEQVGARLTAADRQELLNRRSPWRALSDVETIECIERWANLRLQTLYNTLEGARQVFAVYRRLAEQYFPAADAVDIEELVKSKVQVILLHDCYPAYPADHPQKLRMDDYCRRHTEVELRWPLNLIHASKSGAWANVMAFVRGAFLMTLDADHSINIEEISYLPNLLREFDADPKLDAVQYRLCSFNDKYSWISKCAAVAEDSWWIQDLRVKSLIGGGGAYGKLVYRVASIAEKELIQPDSVCEDMLTMARLQTDDANIKFIEYMQIGQGNDVTYRGLKRKYGRYPVGGIESSLSKLFKEMLLSTKTGWHRKAEALFMVSHYPIEGLVVYASFAALLSSAFKVTPGYLPLTFFMIGYLLIVSQTLQLFVNLSERHGYRKGIRLFLSMYLPINVLYVSYIPHYLEQLRKGLRGNARFNISEKLSEQTQDDWRNTYRENRVPLNIGGLLCGVIVVNLIFNRWTLLSFLAYLPFIYNGIIWAIGPFIFIPRKNKLTKLLDATASLPYVMVRSYIDLGAAIVRRLKTAISN